MECNKKLYRTIQYNVKQKCIQCIHCKKMYMRGQSGKLLPVYCEKPPPAHLQAFHNTTPRYDPPRLQIVENDWTDVTRPSIAPPPLTQDPYSMPVDGASNCL